MSGRPRRVALVGLAAVVSLLATSIPAGAAVTGFGSVKRASPPAAWTPGNALAHTASRLVTVFASDCPPPRGRCASDRGPYMGVFLRRSPIGGAPSWSRAVRLSGRRTQAERASVAADGRNVYAGWVTQTSYRRYRPRKPRVFSLRVSHDGGRRFGPSIRLSGRKGRVDYPTLAASGRNAYAAWTDANTGVIRLARSVDAGRTWTRNVIGSTSSRSRDGFEGFPAVGASGQNVVVAWYADAAGGQVAKVSNAGGTDLAGVPLVALSSSGPDDGSQYASVRGAEDGVSNDVAIAFTTATDVEVAVYDGASLGPARGVVGPWPQNVGGVVYNGSFGPSVEPFGAGGLAIAFTACRDIAALVNDCRSASSSARIDLLFSTSANGGDGWSTPLTVAGSSSRPFRVNDAPGLDVAGGKLRVLFDRRNSSYRDYGVFLRVGIGSP